MGCFGRARGSCTPRVTHFAHLGGPRCAAIGSGRMVRLRHPGCLLDVDVLVRTDPSCRHHTRAARPQLPSRPPPCACSVHDPASTTNTRHRPITSRTGTPPTEQRLHPLDRTTPPPYRGLRCGDQECHDHERLVTPRAGRRDIPVIPPTRSTPGSPATDLNVSGLITDEGVGVPGASVRG